jgi:hypothetical protein
MTLDEAEQQGTVGNLTRFFFEVSNEGTATSAALQLRVTLDDQLEHVQLRNGNDRQLFVSIRPLQPAESRRYRLEVRPTLAGLAVNTAELLDGDSQLALEVFRVNSSEPVAPTTP